MQHHTTLGEEARAGLFSELPQPFSRSSDREDLAYALGATLYVPATRPDLAGTLRRRAAGGAVSMVVCLEDAVADDEVEAGLANLTSVLAAFAVEEPECLPLLFVRVRTAAQVAAVAEADTAHVVSGFVLPKFDADRGTSLLASVADVATSRRVFAMPVLESAQLADPRTRVGCLSDAAELLGKFPGLTLAARVGATDIAGALGLRRLRELTAYDVGVVRDAITDIRAVVGCDPDVVPVVTGCVWEFFSDHSPRLFRPMLRQTAFAERGAVDLRGQLLAGDLDGLVRELVLDKANGLVGKTVIHPSHVNVVHAALTVTHEEATDAATVLGGIEGGVARSEYRNKMNELRPHRGWALRIQARAKAFGVLSPTSGWVDLLSALQDAA